MRYIDAELAKEALMDWETDPTDEEIKWTIDCVPTADVVPKSELDKALATIEQFEKTIDNGVETCNGCHAKYAEQKSIEIKTARIEAANDFANFLIDKSRGGKIFICDIPELYVKYVEGLNK